MTLLFGSLRKRTRKPNPLVLLIKLCKSPKQLKHVWQFTNPFTINLLNKILLLQFLLNYKTIGSSNPRKVKRVRGSNKCKEVASLEAGTKLKVTFYNNRTVGKNSNLFSRHLGKIIRDCNMCPLGVSSWSDIKQQKFDHMWAAITVTILNYIIIVFIFSFFVLYVNENRDH